MIRPQNFINIIILVSTILSASTQYSSLYLMEFENINKDFTINHLQKAFPDLIKENYAFRTDIQVEYAGDIEPYLSNDAFVGENPALIVNGRYFSTGKRVDVELEAYDIHTWELLEKKNFFCNGDDVVCLHDAFLIAIEEMLSPHFADDGIIYPNEDVKLSNRTADLTYSNTTDEPSYTIYEGVQNNIFDELDEMATYAEFNFDINQNNSEHGQYGDRYFREFDFSSGDAGKISSVDDNTSNLINIIDQFLRNPYNVQIGEMDVKFNKYNREMVDVVVPVEYAVKNSLIQDLLLNIPHEKLINSSGLVQLKFSNSDFKFDPELVEKLAYMKYQVFPVLYFTSEKGELQQVVIDTWKKKYSGIEINDIPLIRVDNYSPLFSIKPSSNSIQINIDVSNLVTTYQFSVPYNTFGKYTKLSIKFLLESQLDRYLSVTYSNN